MKPLTLEQAAQWAGGTPRGTGLITHVTIHSKTAYPGSLFVALPGTRVDGHQFVLRCWLRGIRHGQNGSGGLAWRDRKWMIPWWGSRTWPGLISPSLTYLWLP